MPLDDVYLISDKLDLATDVQVRAAEAALRTRFPPGYREYVITLGAGQLNGHLRVLTPEEIVEATAEWRAIEADATTSAEESGFSRWELVQDGLDLLPPDRWLEAVLLVEDQHAGHHVVFHPAAPGDLFFIPDEEMAVYRAGRDLEEALTWFLETGTWATRTRVLLPDGQWVERPVRYFEPDGDRMFLSFDMRETVRLAEVRAHLLDLARRQPANTLFVSEAYSNDDGTEGEVLHLFVQEYGGAIWCNDMEPYITIQISYDQQRRTAGLDQLIAFCRERARRQF